MPRRLGSGGFTVIDLVVVVGIVAILAAIFLVNIPKIRAGFDLRNASSRVVSEVRRAQAAAIAQGTRYAVEFVLTSPYQVKTWKESSYGSNDWGTTPERSLAGVEWPTTVSIVAATSNSLENCRSGSQASILVGTSANKCVIFAFFGAPVSAGEVKLQSTTGGTTRIVVQPATGRVSEEQ